MGWLAFFQKFSISSKSYFLDNYTWFNNISYEKYGFHLFKCVCFLPFARVVLLVHLYCLPPSPLHSRTVRTNESGIKSLSFLKSTTIKYSKAMWYLISVFYRLKSYHQINCIQYTSRFNFQSHVSSRFLPIVLFHSLLSCPCMKRFMCFITLWNCKSTIYYIHCLNFTNFIWGYAVNWVRQSYSVTHFITGWMLSV